MYVYIYIYIAWSNSGRTLGKFSCPKEHVKKYLKMSDCFITGTQTLVASAE